MGCFGSIRKYQIDVGIKDVQDIQNVADVFDFNVTLLCVVDSKPINCVGNGDIVNLNLKQ